MKIGKIANSKASRTRTNNSKNFQFLIQILVFQIDNILEICWFSKL